MTADDLDTLYGVDPAEFVTRRKELAAAAKKRGDADAAREIAAARRPTTAAWVVNHLVRVDGTVGGRLVDLGAALRDAHASMDGARIRELSSAQRTLVDKLVRAGLSAAGVSEPSAALRDDVVGTLQAAVADPEVAARLGRLSKAERWSGFGEFGSSSTVGPAPTPKREPRTPPSEPEPGADVTAAARERVAVARVDVEAAGHDHAVAADDLAERTSKLATARRRYEKLLESLGEAERELNTADAEYADAESSARAAADRADTAKAVLAEAESALADLAGGG